MTTINIATANISDVRDRAKMHYENSLAKGISPKWYSTEYHALAEVIAKCSGLSISQSCAIISVFSPNCKWLRNKALAVNFTKAIVSGINPDVNYYYTQGCNPFNSLYIRKAISIASLSSQYSESDEMLLSLISKETSFKTRFFYLNGKYPKEDRGVTIDSHMLKIVDGIYRGRDSLTCSKNTYFTLSGIISELAYEQDILPHEYQAMVWVDIVENYI